MTDHPHSALRPAEGRIWHAVVHAATRKERALKIDAAAMAVRGSFLAWLLAEGAAETAPLLVQLTLLGASVEAPFDLRGLRLTLTPRFVGCKLPEIDLSDATTVGFEVLAGTVRSISADRLSTASSLTVRATFASDMIPEHYRGTPTIERQLRLNGATIRGNLDLRGAAVATDAPPQQDLALFADGLTVSGNALLGDGFSAEGEVRMNGCKIGRNLDFTGARLRARNELSLSAAEAKICGSLLLCQTEPRRTNRLGARMASAGVVRLTNTRIDGSLDCDGGAFIAPRYAEPPLPAVAGALKPILAIQAAGISVGGAVYLGAGFYAKGCVHLVNAKVGSDLQASGGHFDHPGNLALEADGIEVAGTTFLGPGVRLRNRAGRPLSPAPVAARASGFLSFNYGQLKQGLYVDGLVFRPRAGVAPPPELRRSGNCGLIADLAKIGGDFHFHDLERIGPALPWGVEIELFHAKADTLDDDPDSWSLATTVNITGFEYDTIAGLRPDATWRLDLVDQHYGVGPQGRGRRPLRSVGGALRLLASTIGVWILRWLRRPPPPDPRSLRFDPQPYLQLAKVTEQSGYADAATRIRIRLEENLTRLGDFGFWKLLGRYILGMTIRYGYRPSYAVFWLLVWTGVTWTALSAAPPGQISTAGAEASGGIGRPPPSELSYSPFLFALDSLLPIVDLHQKSRWVIEPPHCAPWTSPAPIEDGWPANCRHWLTAVHRVVADPLRAPALISEGLRRSAVPLLGIVNPFLGWALTSLFVAGVSGLVRRS